MIDGDAPRRVHLQEVVEAPREHHRIAEDRVLEPVGIDIDLPVDPAEWFEPRDLEIRLEPRFIAQIDELLAGASPDLMPVDEEGLARLLEERRMAAEQQRRKEEEARAAEEGATRKKRGDKIGVRRRGPGRRRGR